MAFLRLIVACVLAVALPLQGLAGTAMLGCGAGQGVEAHRALPNGHGHAAHAQGPATPPAASPEGAQVTDLHAACAACASACCHAVALPAPRVPAAERLAVPAEPLPAPLHYASWAEPVPHKPPRS